jgi:hypothetical protein
MKYFKYATMGLAALTLLGILVLGVIYYVMNSASKAGSEKIEALEKEFAAGQSIDQLISRAEKLGINVIWWVSEAGEVTFDDNKGVPNEYKPLDFHLIGQQFQSIQTGKISLLAYGSYIMERTIIELEFVNRKVTKSTIRRLN